MSRASRSVPPPAGNGTPIFTGRDGKLCASAPGASAMAASRPISGAVILFILVLLPAAQILFTSARTIAMLMESTIALQHARLRRKAAWCFLSYARDENRIGE